MKPGAFCSIKPVLLEMQNARECIQDHMTNFVQQSRTNPNEFRLKVRDPDKYSLSQFCIRFRGTRGDARTFAILEESLYPKNVSQESFDSQGGMDKFDGGQDP